MTDSNMGSAVNLTMEVAGNDGKAHPENLQFVDAHQHDVEEPVCPLRDGSWRRLAISVIYHE
jgi:hypothetical protein